MDKEKIIVAQAKEIVELREALSTLTKNYIIACDKQKKTERVYDRLFFEFSRSLEVIRGAGLKFESEIIEAETMKGIL